MLSEVAILARAAPTTPLFLVMVIAGLAVVISRNVPRLKTSRGLRLLAGQQGFVGGRAPRSRDGYDGVDISRFADGPTIRGRGSIRRVVRRTNDALHVAVFEHKVASGFGRTREVEFSTCATGRLPFDSPSCSIVRREFGELDLSHGPDAPDFDISYKLTGTARVQQALLTAELRQWFVDSPIGNGLLRCDISGDMVLFTMRPVPPTQLPAVFTLVDEFFARLPAAMIERYG